MTTTMTTTPVPPEISYLESYGVVICLVCQTGEQTSTHWSPVAGSVELHIDGKLPRPALYRLTAAWKQGNSGIGDPVERVRLPRLFVSHHKQEEVAESQESD